MSVLLVVAGIQDPDHKRESIVAVIRRTSKNLMRRMTKKDLADLVEVEKMKGL
jgi:hypothetical protein